MIVLLLFICGFEFSFTLVLAYFVCSLVLSIILGLLIYIAPVKFLRLVDKISAYECGFQPYGGTRATVDIK